MSTRGCAKFSKLIARDLKQKLNKTSVEIFFQFPERGGAIHKRFPSFTSSIKRRKLYNLLTQYRSELHLFFLLWHSQFISERSSSFELSAFSSVVEIWLNGLAQKILFSNFYWFFVVLMFSKTESQNKFAEYKGNNQIQSRTVVKRLFLVERFATACLKALLDLIQL